MTGGYTRGLGALILVACSWWALNALTDIASVSPVHWGLLLPHLALVGFPAFIGGITAGALLLGRGVARALMLGLIVAVAQAAAISWLAPEFEQRYSDTVEHGRALERDSAFGLSKTP